MMDYKEYRKLCEEYNHTQKFPKERKQDFLEKHKFYMEEYDKFIDGYKKAEDKHAYLRDRYMKQKENSDLLIYVYEWNNGDYRLNTFVKGINAYFYDMISAI